MPDEACGLLVGPLGGDGEPTGAVTEARPCRNADASARTYTVDPRDMLARDRAPPRRAAHEIVGVWHSHTHTDAYPSPTDVRQAVDPAWMYVIVSLRDQTPGAARVPHPRRRDRRGPGRARPRLTDRTRVGRSAHALIPDNCW